MLVMIGYPTPFKWHRETVLVREKNLTKGNGVNECRGNEGAALKEVEQRRRCRCLPRTAYPVECYWNLTSLAHRYSSRLRTADFQLLLFLYSDSVEARVPCHVFYRTLDRLSGLLSVQTASLVYYAIVSTWRKGVRVHDTRPRREICANTQRWR